MRVEHEDHAKSHGKAVGANMAGAGAPYDHLPFFYSDLFDLGYEAVGRGRLPARGGGALAGAEPQGRRRVRRRGKPRGVLFWNVWDKLERGRELIRAGEGAVAV